MDFKVTDGPYAAAKWTGGSVLGEEALSEHYSFSIVVATDDPGVLSASHAELQEELLGRAVSLEMHKDASVRYGVIASVEVEPRRAEWAYARLRFTMRPRAWLLTLRKNTRMFQGLYLHQIVSLVLAESEIVHRWSLSNTYPRRVYCTQYEETDDAFIRRLLAEEGVFWFYEHVTTFEPTVAGHASTDVATVVGGIAAAGGAITSAIASAAESGSGAVIGSASSIIGDAVMPATDPEADDPREGGAGAVGSPKGPTEVFVFCDKAASYGAAVAADNNSPLELHYRTDGGGFVTNAVTSLSGVRTVGTRAVEIRDYDFRRPLALLASRDDTAEAHGISAPRKTLEHYEHHGEYEKTDISEEQARIRLEQLRASTNMVAGQSTCPRLMPGFTLDFADAPAPFATGRYVPVKVVHEAYGAKLSGTEGASVAAETTRTLDAVAALLREVAAGGQTYGEGELRARLRSALSSAEAPPKQYQNRFEWVSAETPFRPPRPNRIRHAVNESAVVVGPAGKAIYVDAYGRVKVQFQWDRVGKYNEASSCWIRVLSTWAGAGYGFQFFPRVGMEVVVSFIGGDPDRPVITGSLYNATHPTPEPLPQRFTRSGMRSQTVPGGGGFNELSFEDAQGLERVFIHAQKDLHEVVNDAHTTTVRGAQTTTIGEAQTLAVSADQIVGVGGHSSFSVGKSYSEQIGGDRVERVTHNSSQRIHGSATREVRGVAICETLSDDLHVVRGDHSLTVQGHQVVHVVMPKEGPKACSTTYVDGSSFHTATERVLIRADQNLRLQCGDSYLEITSDGITLSSANVKLAASDSVVVTGANVDVTGSDHVKLHREAESVTLDSRAFKVAGVPCVVMKTSAAKLVLDGATAELCGSSEARVKGAAVKLMSGSTSDSASAQSTESSSESPATKHLKVAFVHPRGSELAEPIRDTPYRVTAGDVVLLGTTDGDGAIDVEVPELTKQVTVVLFVERVADYAARYDKPVVWNLHVETDLFAADAAKGARLRLRNLGYAPGPDLSITDLAEDPITTEALAQFQRDHRLPPSGKLSEDDTHTVLDEASGSVR